jgi:CxxC motif-containing protein (DUF1111 family)
MGEDQCQLLTGFVRHLAPPLRRPADNGTLPPWGFLVFQSIGCATCHAPRLGAVSGVFSDLLLHDMGESSSDVATYYGAPVAPAPSGELAGAQVPAPRRGPTGFTGMPVTRRRDPSAKTQERPRPSGPATAAEWRTPPLWGVADSPPYLHDGRASTLDAAIRLHTARPPGRGRDMPGSRPATAMPCSASSAR